MKTAGTILLLAALAPCAWADYAAATGFTQLQAEAGAGLPNGAGVKMSIVEAALNNSEPPPYLPATGSGMFMETGLFDGLTFSVKSLPGTFSSHAQTVGSHMAGNLTDPALGSASMAPGVTQLDCYYADTFDDDLLAPLPLKRAPSTETSQVQNHSYIGYASEATAATYNDWLRRLDFSIARDRYLSVAGVNNGGSTPDLNAAAYNILSVGLSNGNHSTGPTSAFCDGPGRLKPEIVAPLFATSWATGYVSSAGALLRAQANTLGDANALKSFLLKAILLAGATKEEFPAWTRTASHPLDATFGAGELNIAHSFHILNGGEQPASAGTARPDEAWDVVPLTASGQADYTLTIPPGSYGVELSAFAVWERTLADAAGPGYQLVPDALIDFNLALYRDPAGGGSPILIDASTSTLYNLEHIHQLSLPSGSYRLRITRNAGATREVALAWRLKTAAQAPFLLASRIGGMIDFTFTGLVVGQSYAVETSPSLTSWTTAHSFLAATTSEVWSTSDPLAAGRAFYRILPAAQ